MTQEEIKTLLLTHLNLDEFRKAETERFFSECAGITLENYQEKFLDWQNSKSGKVASIQIMCGLRCFFQAMLHQITKSQFI